MVAYLRQYCNLTEVALKMMLQYDYAHCWLLLIIVRWNVPIVRRLSPEEVQAQEKRVRGARKLIEEEYNAFLSDYDVGDYGIAELNPDESRLVVRNRLKAAATRRGLSLVFRRTKGLQLRFHVQNSAIVTEPSVKSTPKAKKHAAVVVEASAPETPKKKPGRPRKNP